MLKNVLIVVGSLREKSFNRQLAARVEEIIGGRAAVSYLDYADVPFLNQDAEFPAPEPVARVRVRFREADGVWICAPEYNASAPGILKNLLDWMSRPLAAGDFAGGTAIGGKKVALCGAGGKNATRGSRAALRQLLEFVRAEVVGGDGIGVALPGGAFGTDVLELSAGDEELLRKQVDVFLAAL